MNHSWEQKTDLGDHTLSPSLVEVSDRCDFWREKLMIPPSQQPRDWGQRLPSPLPAHLALNPLSSRASDGQSSGNVLLSRSHVGSSRENYHIHIKMLFVLREQTQQLIHPTPQ